MKNTYKVLSLLSIASMSALLSYDRVSVTNNTPYKVTIHAGYASCRSDDWTVQPGQTAEAPSGRGACLLQNLEATVYEEIIEGKPVPKGARNYYSSGTSYSQFAVTGPAYDANKQSYYTVTRIVN